MREHGGTLYFAFGLVGLTRPAVNHKLEHD
jgi:hypothetical protein